MEIKWDKVVGVVICHHGFMLLIIVLFSRWVILIHELLIATTLLLFCCLLNQVNRNKKVKRNKTKRNVEHSIFNTAQLTSPSAPLSMTRIRI